MELARDEVHCWYVGLDVSPGTCAALSATLSPDELIRSARMRSPQLQRRFTVARAGLRALLGRYLGAHPSQVSFVHNEFGKPALSGRFGGRLAFNLSHSADLAVVGIAADAEVGVDVEQIRNEPGFIEVAQWLFAGAEVDELNRLPSELRTRAFLSSWTRKEAYAKARGEGLGATNAIAQPQGWSLYALQPPPRYVGALVVEGSGWRVTQRFASLDAVTRSIRQTRRWRLAATHGTLQSRPECCITRQLPKLDVAGCIPVARSWSGQVGGFSVPSSDRQDFEVDIGWGP